MKKTNIYLALLLLFSLPLMAQPLPDSLKQAEQSSPAEQTIQAPLNRADSSGAKTPAPRQPAEKTKPAAPKQPAEKQSPPKQSAKQDPVKQEKPLPRVAVMDFANHGGAPAKLCRTIPERMRFYLLNSGKCRVADAGEVNLALAELGFAHPDSIGNGQMALLAQKLKADYIISGSITDYREGDIEFKKHKLELMGKMLWGSNGELCAMEVVKTQKKGDVQDMANGAAEELAEKMAEKVK